MVPDIEEGSLHVVDCDAGKPRPGQPVHGKLKRVGRLVPGLPVDDLPAPTPEVVDGVDPAFDGPLAHDDAEPHLHRMGHPTAVRPGEEGVLQGREVSIPDHRAVLGAGQVIWIEQRPLPEQRLHPRVKPGAADRSRRGPSWHRTGQVPREALGIGPHPHQLGRRQHRRQRHLDDGAQFARQLCHQQLCIPIERSKQVPLRKGHRPHVVGGLDFPRGQTSDARAHQGRRLLAPLPCALVHWRGPVDLTAPVEGGIRLLGRLRRPGHDQAVTALAAAAYFLQEGRGPARPLLSRPPPMPTDQQHRSRPGHGDIGEPALLPLVVGGAVCPVASELAGARPAAVRQGGGVAAKR